MQDSVRENRRPNLHEQIHTSGYVKYIGRQGTGKARHRQGKAQPSKTRQGTGKARQDKAQPSEAKQGKAEQCKARQDTTRHSRPRQGKTRQDTSKQGEAIRGFPVPGMAAVMPTTARSSVAMSMRVFAKIDVKDGFALV